MTGRIALSKKKLSFLTTHSIKKLSLTIALSALAQQGFALGLGELSHSSALGQPLAARIELISPDKEYDANEVKVRQLSAEQAATMGVELLSFYQRFEIEPVLKNGKLYINLSSDDAVTEPFVNIFIELKWPNGQVYREYTLLLDPPSIQPSVSSRPQAREQTSTQPQSVQQPQQAVKRRSPVAMAISDDQYRVRSGDSLSRIAQRLSRGTSHDYRDMMNWLLANNQHAFIKGDPNRLKAAVIMTVPNEANWSTVPAPEPVTVESKPEPQQSDVRKLTPLPAVKQQPTSVAEPEPTKASEAAPTEPRLTLKNKASASETNDLANLSEQQMLERIRQTKEQNDRLQRENKAIEARLSRLEGSDYIKSLERLVQLREQELAELKANQAQQDQMDAAAAEAAPSRYTGNQASVVTIDSQVTEAAKAKQAEKADAPSSTNRIIIWALLAVALLGSGYFYFMSRRKPREIDIEKPGFDEDAELARLDEALAGQDDAIGFDANEEDLNFSSLFDASGKPTGAEHVGKWRPDEALSKKIKSKTQEYVPDAPKGFSVVHHHEHDNLDDLISDALAYCAQGYFDRAESMLMAEQATRGDESRITTALDYVRNLKQQS